MKGYKAFDKDLKCKDFQFKIGETFEIKETVKLCSIGFHFCENAFDVYNYYPKESKTRICEIQAIGLIEKEDDKYVTNKIKIIKELSDLERLDLWIKRNNSRYGDSGDSNSGNWNSGYGNSGYFNTTTPLYLFNKPSNIIYTEDFANKIRSINVKPILKWVTTKDMTELDKINNPSYKTTDGFLQKTGKQDWNYLTL